MAWKPDGGLSCMLMLERPGPRGKCNILKQEDTRQGSSWILKGEKLVCRLDGEKLR